MQSKWQKVKLGNVVEDLTNSRLIEVGDNDKIVEPTISSKTHTIDTRKELFGKDVRVKKRVKLIPGDLIFARLHTQNGLFAFCDKEYIATQTFVPVKINEEKIDREYLFFALRVFIKNLATSGDSVGRETYKPRQILDLEIPLPPLDEQKRLAAKIKGIEKNAAKVKSAQNVDIGAIVRAYSREFFAQNFPSKIFNDVFEVTKLAGFEYTKYFKFVDDKQIIALRAQNVKNTGLKLDEVKYISTDLSNSLQRSKLHKNNIVLTFIGAGTGESAIIDEDDKYHCAPNIAKLTVNEKSAVSPQFALAQIRSAFVQDQILEITRQTAQPSLSMRIIRKLKFKIPRIKDQKAFLEKLDKIQASTDILQTEFYRREQAINALMPSVLSKAFSGAL